MQTRAALGGAASGEDSEERMRRALSALCEKRIFFAHESVGANLLHGVQHWFGRHADLRLQLVESEDPATLAPGTWVHARFGHNGDPGRKLTRLRELVERGIGANADLVLFKLCYVDVGAQTGIEALHGRITEALGELRRRYPRTELAMMTVPLTAMQRGPKAWARRLLRRLDANAEDNLHRQALNQRLRRSEATLFDLAWLESLDTEGQQATQMHRGLAVPVLADCNTDDGGHLNAAGQVRLARALVEFAAGLGESTAHRAHGFRARVERIPEAKL